MMPPSLVSYFEPSAASILNCSSAASRSSCASSSMMRARTTRWATGSIFLSNMGKCPFRMVLATTLDLQSIYDPVEHDVRQLQEFSHGGAAFFLVEGERHFGHDASLSVQHVEQLI